MKLQHLTEKQKGLGAIFTLTIVYGILPLFPRYLDTAFELFQQVYLRMFVGFVILLILFHRQINFKKMFALRFPELRGIFLRAFFYYTLGVGLYTVAILMTKVSNVVFIGSIPFTALLGFVLLREKVTVPKVLLLLLSACGLFIISFKGMTGIPEFGVGELFALISSFFISLGLVTRRMQSNHLNDYETATIMLLFAGLQLFAVSFFVGEPLPLSGWSGGIFLILLASGLTVAALSFLMNYGFARVEVVIAGNIIAISNFFSILTAFIAFGEVPILREFLGGLLIITSAIMMHRFEKKELKRVTEDMPPRE